MSSLLNIGINGLQAHQAALNVTGQNITNASTPGYSRQRAEIVTANGSATAGLSAGSGARVDQITRIAEDYASAQIRVDQSLSSELSAFSRSVSQLEGTLYDDGFGIDGALRSFFDALQNASNNPFDTATRQFVISQGGALAGRFNSVAERVEQQRVDLNSSLEASASRVNEVSKLIANVNARISLLKDGSSGLNAMIDERDNLLKELSSWVGVTTAIQSDGQANVFVGKGQTLVLGAQTAELSVAVTGGVQMRQIGTTTEQDVTSILSGGEIGGLLSYRTRVLDEAQNDLGHLAASVVHAFNAQHNLGIDLNGNFGGDFFGDLNDANLVGQRVGVIPGEPSNSSIGQVNVYIEDPLASSPSSYELRVDADGSFAVKRQSDGALVYQGPNITSPMSIEFDGLRVEFADGSFSPGDSMLLQPYTSYGDEMRVALTDPPALALGLPVAVTDSATNTGSAVMSVVQITDPGHPIFSGDAALYPPLLVRFISESQFEILDNTDPTNPQRLSPDLGVQNYVQGSQRHVLPYIEGTTSVASSGPQVAVLPGAATLVSDLSAGINNYPSGTMTVSYADDVAGSSAASVNVAAASSAREIAAALDTLSGVTASSRTAVDLTNLVNHESGVPVEIAVNGELITGFSSLNELADSINANTALQNQGVVASSDGQVLTLTALSGDDLTLHFQGDPNESITLTDAKGGSLVMNGNVAGTYRRATIGGQVTALVEPDAQISSQLDGIFAATPEHRRADFGFDLLLSGNVAAGDEFAVSFSGDAGGDNRNAQALGALSELQIIGDPPETFGSAFASLILDVGAAASQAQVNESAAKALLQQSETFRESISGVNLDEEAANLIRFEQAYNASAQIISVARETFDTLLNSFR